MKTTMPENGLSAVRKSCFYGLPAGFFAGWNHTLRRGANAF